MSDKKPGDTNPTHIPNPTSKPPAPPRPTPRPYTGAGHVPSSSASTGRRPVTPPPSGPGPRRPAMHPTTGERPKRRIAPDTRHPNPEGRAFLIPDSPADHTASHTHSPSPRRRARRRTQFAAFNIVMIVIIAVIGLTIFAMSFQSIFAEDRGATTVTPTPTPTATPLPLNTQHFTGIITGINDQATLRTMTIKDIATNHSRDFSFLDSTSLANRTGISIPFSTLAIGNMMEVAYNPDNNELLDLRQSFTRDFHSRTGVRIDMENTSITLGNDVLTFTSQTLVLYRGAPALISDITEDDIVTIIAVSDVIWLIQIESSHGLLQVTSSGSIINGRIILDPIGTGTPRIMALNDIGTTGLTMPEGTYRVTVEGTNIETYITELSIHHGETTTLDLSNVEPGVAVLELTVTPANAQVFINGELMQNHREPMEFDFDASLTIRVEREGYVTQERTIVMSQITTTATINLEVEIITAMVTIMTYPIGANVWINNVPVGQSPVLTELTPGSHDIILQMHGFNDLFSTIYAPPGESAHNLVMTQIIEEPPPYTPPYEEAPGYNYNEGGYEGGVDY